METGNRRDVAPEQRGAAPTADARADIYALGATHPVPSLDGTQLAFGLSRKDVDLWAMELPSRSASQ